jgi:glycosyltransferase involved in cell wall biosynthesis
MKLLVTPSMISNNIKNSGDEIEVSVVMPCLNEADTLAVCIKKALRAMKQANICGEVIIADNGSTDGSIEIAQTNGAKVVNVNDKGYGNALMGGISAAQGKYIIMGDADDSYDFSEIPKFTNRLREGFDLVQGCRSSKGGGKFEKGATPWAHKWIGGPFFRWMIRSWFKAPINDVHCGLRGFSKDHYLRINQRCTGMEFASEMIIKSCLYGARMSEIPITLHKDGRIAHPPHLRTIRDGWRHLRFMFIYSPNRIFTIPGILLILFGVVGYFVAVPRFSIHGITFDINTLMFSSLAIICGYQGIFMSVFAKTFAYTENLMPITKRMSKFLDALSVERVLILGLTMFALGITFLLIALKNWYTVHFGPLDYSHMSRIVIPGSTLVVVGFQTIISSFIVGMFKLSRK